tara:strand:- start:1937 stop:2602 length:666 start_codon:yes stop_codon:yes gene_type:complete
MESSQKTRFLFKAYFNLFGLYILYAILMAILPKIIPGLDLTIYKQEFIHTMLLDEPLKAFIMIVVFAPIIEEMMFRSLIKPNHIELVLFLAIWPVFFLTRFIPLDVYWWLKLIFIAIFLFTVVYIGQQIIPKEKTEKIRGWLTKRNSILLILTSLLFGFVHINNYVEEFTFNLALFLLILPRIIAGFMMGLVKIRNKYLPWSIALHALNNGFAFAILLLFR